MEETEPNMNQMLEWIEGSYRTAEQAQEFIGQLYSKLYAAIEERDALQKERDELFGKIAALETHIQVLLEELGR